MQNLHPDIQEFIYSFVNFQFNQDMKLVSWNAKFQDFLNLAGKIPSMHESIFYYFSEDDSELLDQNADLYLTLELENSFPKIQLKTKITFKKDESLWDAIGYCDSLDFSPLTRIIKGVGKNLSPVPDVLDTLPDIISYYSISEQRMYTVNSRVEDLLGHSPEDFLKPLMILVDTLIHPDDRYFFSAKLLDFIKKKADGICQLDYRIQHNMGFYVYLESRIFCSKRDFSTGEPLELVFITREESHRKVVEEKNKLSEKLMKEAQKMAKIGTWEFDLSTKRMDWSEECHRIFELKSKEFPDYKEVIKKFASIEKYKIIHSVRRLFLKNGFKDLFVVQKNENSLIYTEIIGKPFINSTGKIIKFYGSVMDITERVEYQANLTKAKELAEKA